jgi:ABC-2 type transport system ATP-binding protein
VAVHSPDAQRRLESLHEVYAAINRGEYEAVADRWFAPDAKLGVKEGTISLREGFLTFQRSQHEQFEITFRSLDVFEAADGTLVVCNEVERRPRDGGDAFTVWPATAIRFNDQDRIVYFEGYPRQDEALSALGIDAIPPAHGRREEGACAIRVTGLRREFPGGIAAVDGIDLAVKPGEIYAFLGPNGAGKTTTVRMLTTLLRPTDGSAEVAGFDVEHDAHKVRQSIGVALQEAALDPLMTGRELIVLQATLHSIPPREAKQRAAQLLERVGLTRAGDRRVGTYSGGMRRRLDLAMALVHEPRVLFLDEPTTGLDPQSRRAIWDEVRALNDAGTTVFLTTQYLEEADELADRVGIIHHGRMAAEGTPAALKAGIGRTYLEVAVSGDAEAADEVLRRFGEVLPERDGHRRVTLPEGARGIPQIVRALDEAGLPVESLKVVEPSLDDVFLATTGEQLEGDDAPPEPEPAEAE